MKPYVAVRLLLVFAVLISNIAFPLRVSANEADLQFYSDNDILFYDPNATDCGTSAQLGSGVLSGNSNLEKIYNYFLGKGLTDVQAAGIVGNISQESNGDPTVSQNPKGNTNDPSQFGTAVGVGKAWGIIQWDAGGRAIEYAKQAGITGPIYELSTQLDLVWWHLNNESPTAQKKFIDTYNKITDVEEATRSYEHGMEGAGKPMMTNRITAAKLALSTYTKNPTTSGGGTLPSNASAVASTTQCSSACPVSSTPSKVDVVIDPGHSGTDTRPTYDPLSNLQVGEYANHPEMEDMFEVAQLVDAKLKAKGYTTLITKTSANQSMTLAKRAEIANEANAQIAVSLHDTPGSFGDKSGSWVTPQKVGGYRVNKDGKTIQFSNADLAAKSQQYSQIMIDARKKNEPGTVEMTINFDERGTYFAKGNLPMVSLLSKVPWVYNEAGQTGLNKEKYADGVANGIMNAIKPSGGTPAPSGASSSGCGAVGGGKAGIVQTALNYAWPENANKLGKGYVTKKDIYEKAVQAAKQAGKYTGDTCHGGGVDCGAFVTRVMQDSGADPNYGGGGNTAIQLQYLLAHPEKYEHITPKTTADMQPGDIAVQNNRSIHHTYLYVGSGLTGSDNSGKATPFESNIASAAQCSRAPMAGWEKPADPDYEWFRMKG